MKLTHHQRQQMARQMPNLDPRGDQKTHIVKDFVQIRFPLAPVPANELVARGNFPRRRTEEKTPHHSLLTVHGKVTDRLTHSGAEAQVMIGA
jgi:hypothetical protein